MQLTAVVGSLLLAYTIWQLFRFLKTYSLARRIGLPIVIIPVDFQSTPWRILSVPLKPLMERYLPEKLAFGLVMAIFGAEFLLKDQILARYGPLVTLCGIGSIQIMSGDADASMAVLQKPKDYLPPAIVQQIMSICGPNVISTTGDTWRRQRSVIAPVINEKISNATWDESAVQADSLVRIYTSRVSGTSTSLKGLKQLAFNMLGCVGYGKPIAFRDPELAEESASSSPFVDSLSKLANNLVIVALIPVNILLSPVMPKFVQNLGKALKDFPMVTKNLVEEERQNQSSSVNIMSTMVKVLDQEKETSKVYLAPEEVAGNLFVFTLAGYDTTANTLGFALTNLAVYPQWQAWMQEEIDQVSKGPPGYTVLFPQLRRVLAVMFETLRLYTPLMHALREGIVPVTIKTEDGVEHTIPAGVEICISMALVHVNEKYWGKDAIEFRPDRWIKEDGTLLEPARGTFMPFSFGPRSCPGLKMAQVEFVSVLYTIFKQCQVEPVPRKDESLDQARLRLNEEMMNSMPLITLQMQRPEEVELKWSRR